MSEKSGTGMTRARWGFRGWFVVLLAWTAVVLRGDEAGDPAAKWLSVYAWIQTADRLAEAGQWPLALGSYLEADRQIAELAASHPAFEPEMVAYRREALTATISSTEGRLTDDEHETMMKYRDFIESLEAGESLRYENRFEEAYGTLGMAKALLDEIVEKKPVEFREAVASQLERLESSLAWLDSQLNLDKRAPAGTGATFDPSVDWGTTRFVKPGDLPQAAGSGVGGALFPGGPIEETKEETKETPSTEESSGARRFRMSSSQPSSGEGPPKARAGTKP